MRRILLALAVLGALLAPVTCLATGEPEKPNRVNQIAEKAKPGIFAVQTVVKGTVVIPEPTLNQEAFAQLVEKTKSLVVSGALPNDETALKHYLTKELLSQPRTYLRPSKKTDKKDGSFTILGTGFAVSEDGYCITNAHVVKIEEKAAGEQMLVNSLKDELDKGVEGFEQSSGMQTTEEEQVLLKKAILDYYIQYVQIEDVEKDVNIALGAVVPGVAMVQTGVKSDIRKAGEPIPGKDIAIIKSERKNMHTLVLGDSDKVQVGDQIYCIGYPGAATYHPLVDEESALEPTVTAGIISAKKKMKGGWEILQTDATINHGNSGGPAFNEAGEVIGITTFGTPGKSGELVSGYNFIIPINLVKEFMKEINVENKQSLVATHYNKGLDLFWEHRFSKAVPEFEAVNRLSPGNPYAPKYIGLAQEAIERGEDRKDFNYMYLVIGGVVFLIFIAGAVGLVIFLTRKK